MMLKFLTFLHFVLAGSHLISLQASFEKDFASGDINSVKSFIQTNFKLINSPEAAQQRDKFFLLAVEKGRTDVVDLLFYKRIKVNAGSNYDEAIRKATANGNADMVKILLSRREVNPGAFNNEAIVEAARSGKTEIVRLLLAHPLVDPTARKNQALKLASDMNHGDVVKLLFPRITDIDSRRYSLKRAAYFSNVDLIRFLVSHPFFSRNRLGTSLIVLSDEHLSSLKAFKFAVISGDVDLTRSLLRENNFEDINLIMTHSDLQSIKTLVEAGYLFDQVTFASTLNYARENGRNDLVAYLENLERQNALPSKPLIQMNDECGICLQKDSLFNGYMTACKHQFHADCLQQWFIRDASCPMCRAAIV